MSSSSQWSQADSAFWGAPSPAAPQQQPQPASKPSIAPNAVDAAFWGASLPKPEPTAEDHSFWGTTPAQSQPAAGHPVPGMERLGPLPGPPKPPVPAPLQPDASEAPRAPQSDVERLMAARTGRSQVPPAPTDFLGVAGGAQKFVHGAEALADPTSENDYYRNQYEAARAFHRKGNRPVAPPWDQLSPQQQAQEKSHYPAYEPGITVGGIAKSVMSSVLLPPGIGQIATGANIIGKMSPEQADATSSMIHGAIEMANPLIAVSGAAAPYETALTLAAAESTQKGTSDLLRAAGVNPEKSELAGNIAGLLTIGAGARNVADKIWDKLGNPEAKFGPFPEPTPLREMTDAELVAHANGLERNPPKNYDFAREELLKEVLRRQNSRTLGGSPSPKTEPGATASPHAAPEANPAGTPAPAPVAPQGDPNPPAEPANAPPVEVLPRTPEPEAVNPEVLPPQTGLSAPQLQADISSPRRGDPGWIGNVPTDELHVDAPRFQFKRNVGAGGAGEELKGVQRWDPEMAGVTAVWRDPADGLDYVVNGHHRKDLADRLDVPMMAVRYLDAADAQEARLKGALINIAEGRGDAVDAAKVFRDGGIGPAELSDRGVSLKGKVANQGMALAKLSPQLWNSVLDGTMPVERASVIGSSLPGHEDQNNLMAILAQREASGKRVTTNDQLDELIQFAKEAPQVVERPDANQMGLFGDAEEVHRSLLPEKAEVSDYVRKQLGTEKKLFGAVGNQAAAEKLGQAGNVIKVGENAQAAQVANQGLAVYDALKGKTGPIGAVLDRASQELAGGKNAVATKSAAYREIREILGAEVAKLNPGQAAGRAEGLDNQGTHQEPAVPGGSAQVLAARKPSAPLPDTQTESMFGEQAEAESRLSEQQRQAKLLGDQLTAQIRSGMAKAPPKLKPAEQRGMFGQEGPEQENLFSRATGPAQIARHIAQRESRAPAPFHFDPAGVQRLPGDPLHTVNAETASDEDFDHYVAGAQASWAAINGVPAVYVNPSAMDLLIHMAGAAGHGDSAGIFGLTMSPHEARQVAMNRIEEKGPIADAGRRVQRVVRMALLGRGNTPLIIAQAGADIPDPILSMTVQEEYDHALQIQMTDGALSLLPHHLLDSPTGKLAVAGLRSFGYRNLDLDKYSDRGVMMAEVMARLTVPGRYEEMGISAQQARDLTKTIIREIADRFGKTAAPVLDRLYATVTPKADVQGRPGEFPAQRPEPTQGVSGQGGGGLGGLAGQPVSGYQPQQLSLFARKPQGPLAPGSPAEQTLLAQVAHNSKEGKDQLTAAVRALAAAQPDLSSNSFGEKLRTPATGARDWEIAATNQLRGNLQQALPEPLDQEALTIIRDFRNRPGELRQFYEGTHPKYQEVAADRGQRAADAGRDNIRKALDSRPAGQPNARTLLDRAENPSLAVQAADRVLTQYFDEHLREGKQLGMIESSIGSDEYTTHILQPREQEATGKRLARGPRMGPKKFRYANQRTYPTVLHAIANGIRPRTLNALDALTIYGDRYAASKAARLLEDGLISSGWGTRGSPTQQRAGQIPSNWRELAPESRQFRREIPFVDSEGKAAQKLSILYVPPEVDDALRPIYEWNYMQRVPFYMSARMYQTYLKSAELGLSFFHVKALTMMAAANMPHPDQVAQALRTDVADPAFEKAELKWIRAGLTTTVLGRTWEAYRALEPTAAPSVADVVRSWPVVKQIDRAAQAVSRFTFENLQRKFKVVNAELLHAQWLAKHPNASRLQQEEAARGIAKEMNAVYGGLHWENMGVNRITLELARGLFLAPDWTFSNVANAKYAIFGTGAGQHLDPVSMKQNASGEWSDPGAKGARMFWLKAGVSAFGLTAAATLMLSTLGGRSKKDAMQKWLSNPTNVYMGTDKDGNDVYGNWFFTGAPGDTITAIRNIIKYGAPVGLARTIDNKFSPFVRTGVGAASNTDEFSHPIVPAKIKDEDLPVGPRGGAGRRPPTFLEKSKLGAEFALRQTIPVPFSVKSLVQMLLDKDHSWEAQDYISTVLNSRPPTHERPSNKPGPKTSPIPRMREPRIPK